MASEQLLTSYFSTALKLVAQFSGTTPFSEILKSFFGKERKYGSRDRRQIANLCYSYFRMGGSMADELPATKMLAGLFLCSTEQNAILEMMRPDWNEQVRAPINEKISLVGPPFDLHTIFKWGASLSGGIKLDDFEISHLIQPDLFIRIRPGHVEAVLKSLGEAAMPYRQVNEYCLAMANLTDLKKILRLNREAVIQDLNSQRVGELLKRIDWKMEDRAWDCCAASGGKSILLHDWRPGIKLTVSDIRQNILNNLDERLKSAGITGYEKLVTDLSKPATPRPLGGFGLIMADVPCSGSGTWGRNPEFLGSFNFSKVSDFTLLQRNILSAALPSLQPGGYLLYSTCSVFKNENEEMVNFLLQHFPLQLVHMELLEGYEMRADTLFAALLRLDL